MYELRKPPRVRKGRAYREAFDEFAEMFADKRSLLVPDD